MKTVGIIGGLGPETSAKFMLRVVSLCQKRNKLRRPEIICRNVPISFALEEKFINRSEGKREFRTLLINTAQKLEQDGADFIVIPCNTAHIFTTEIRKSVNIPVISIVDETTGFLRKIGVRKVGLLATPATIKNKLFDKRIDFVTPNKINQKKMGIIINNILSNQCIDENRLELLQIINSVSKKSDALLLACTDLQLIVPENKINGLQIFDTMKILADATVREILTPKI